MDGSPKGEKLPVKKRGKHKTTERVEKSEWGGVGVICQGQKSEGQEAGG